MGRRITRMLVAALIFAVISPILAGAIGRTGPLLLIPLVVLAFWWSSRHTTDIEDEPAPKAKPVPVRRGPSGKRVTAPKPKGRRVAAQPNRGKARKR